MKSFNINDAIKAFQLMMNHFYPSNRNVTEYPSIFELQDNLKNITHERDIYIALAQLIEFLQILPASEASSERVFARMRDIHIDKQTNQSAKSLRSDIILSFNVDEYRQINKKLNKIYLIFFTLYFTHMLM